MSGACNTQLSIPIHAQAVSEGDLPGGQHFHQLARINTIFAYKSNFPKHDCLVNLGRHSLLLPITSIKVVDPNAWLPSLNVFELCLKGEELPLFWGGGWMTFIRFYFSTCHSRCLSSKRWCEPLPLSLPHANLQLSHPLPLPPPSFYVKALWTKVSPGSTLSGRKQSYPTVCCEVSWRPAKGPFYVKSWHKENHH